MRELRIESAAPRHRIPVVGQVRPRRAPQDRQATDHRGHQAGHYTDQRDTVGIHRRYPRCAAIANDEHTERFCRRGAATATDLRHGNDGRSVGRVVRLGEYPTSRVVGELVEKSFRILQPGLRVVVRDGRQRKATARYVPGPS